jgi:uncharacterized protein
VPSNLNQQLIAATWKNDVAEATRLITAGADVNAADDTVQSAIVGKGTKPWQDIVTILIAAGANVNVADADGVTPLQHAKSRGYDEIAKVLRSAGAH